MQNDNPTALELSPPEFICDPNPQAIINKMTEIDRHYDQFQNIALEYGTKYLSLMNKNQVGANIIKAYEQYEN